MSKEMHDKLNENAFLFNKIFADIKNALGPFPNLFSNWRVSIYKLAYFFGTCIYTHYGQAI